MTHLDPPDDRDLGHAEPVSPEGQEQDAQEQAEREATPDPPDDEWCRGCNRYGAACRCDELYDNARERDEQ